MIPRNSLLSLQHPQPAPLYSHERQVQASIQECDALQDQQVNIWREMLGLLTKPFIFCSSYTAVFTSNRTTLDTQLGTEKSFKIRRVSQCQNNNAEINGQRQKITETCFDWEVCQPIVIRSVIGSSELNFLAKFPTKYSGENENSPPRVSAILQPRAVSRNRRVHLSNIWKTDKFSLGIFKFTVNTCCDVSFPMNC